MKQFSLLVFDLTVNFCVFFHLLPPHSIFLRLEDDDDDEDEDEMVHIRKREKETQWKKMMRMKREENFSMESKNTQL